MDWVDLAQDKKVAGSYESVNKPLGSIKYPEFLDYLKSCWLGTTYWSHLQQSSSPRNYLGFLFLKIPI
jgi:hypothetical protein